MPHCDSDEEEVPGTLLHRYVPPPIVGDVGTSLEADVEEEEEEEEESQDLDGCV
jgi:hypothetical protein